MPAGEVKGLVDHSQSMDTFGIYGHALQGEDAATSGKLGALFETLAAPVEETDSKKDLLGATPSRPKN